MLATMMPSTEADLKKRRIGCPTGGSLQKISTQHVPHGLYSSQWISGAHLLHSVLSRKESFLRIRIISCPYLVPASLELSKGLPHSHLPLQKRGLMVVVGWSKPQVAIHHSRSGECETVISTLPWSQNKNKSLEEGCSSMICDHWIHTDNILKYLEPHRQPRYSYQQLSALTVLKSCY